MAGMLHDVGRVVFATRSVATAGEPVNSNQEAIAQVEEHHAAVGAYLLGLWGFPDHVVEAVAQHHTPNRRTGTGLDLTVLVHVADQLAHRRSATAAGPVELGIEPGLLEGLGLLDHLPLWSAALEVLDSEQTVP